MTEIAPRIVIDEAVRSGRPVIKGTRVPVDVVLGQLAAGLTPERVAEEYDLERDDVLAVLAYAAVTLGNEEVRAISPMARFLVDEDLPKSLARELVVVGHDAVDVRDVGSRGTPDAWHRYGATISSLGRYMR